MADEIPPAPIPAPVPPEPAQETATPVETPTPAPTEQPAPEPQPIDEAQGKTAQMGRNEPLAPEVEPFDSAQGKPAQAPTTPVTTATDVVRDVLTKARATIQFRKTAKLEKIMSALQKKNHITNDEVEKLLRVSDATATRYLSALEREGKIRQVGKTGKAVEYTRVTN